MKANSLRKVSHLTTRKYSSSRANSFRSNIEPPKEQSDWSILLIGPLNYISRAIKCNPIFSVLFPGQSQVAGEFMSRIRQTPKNR